MFASASRLSTKPLVAAIARLASSATVRADPPEYERDIAPILKKHCLACHAGVMADVSGKLRMETPADLLKGGVSGPPYVAGRSADSLIVKRLEGTIKPKMPLQGEIKNKDIDLIKAWIDSGAPGGATPEPPPTREPGPAPQARVSRP